MITSYVTIPFNYLKTALPYVKGTHHENDVNEYLVNVKENLDYLNSLNRTHKTSINDVIVPVGFLSDLCKTVRRTKAILNSLDTLFKNSPKIQIKYSSNKEYHEISDYLKSAGYIINFPGKCTLSDYDYFVVDKTIKNVEFEYNPDSNIPTILLFELQNLIKEGIENG